MGVTLKDIARDLGVSVITVSKALRDHSDISEQTKARVLRRVQELNYRPNLAARALVTGRTNMIGFVIPDLIHSFFSEVVRGVALTLRNSGYTLVVTSSEQDPKIERLAVEQFITRRVDMLLIASTHWTVELFRRIEEAGIPYILIDRSFVGLAAHFVGVNDEEVGALATQHLFDTGCRRIAHIGGPALSPLLGRLEGYKRAILKNGIAFNSDFVVSTDRPEEMGDEAAYKATQTLLGQNPRPDGIFCYNDLAAYGAMNAVLDAGLQIPEDVSVIGCGNILYNKFLRVPLTSVDQQTGVIGQRAAKLALQIIEAGQPMVPKPIFVEPRLVVRSSTHRPKSAARS
ncbi:MAG: LacI family DNA-binding transcriptional regulator [Acidobacteria bacterium]|nr:LacI family DNA-binding transcriptional regulator [Acidobacteriota bacterium]MBS1867344.1 LacI family DNA-binding transcriptional regulator [Acidobacteriota bacterium]